MKRKRSGKRTTGKVKQGDRSMIRAEERKIKEKGRKLDSYYTLIEC